MSQAYVKFSSAYCIGRAGEIPRLAREKNDDWCEVQIRRNV